MDTITQGPPPDSGVGVLDKAVALLDAVDAGEATLADLVARTGVPRATAHRLALALEHHGLLERREDGRYAIGGRVRSWAGADPLVPVAEAAVIALRDELGESAQVYRRERGGRRCVAAAEPAAGLRDGVPVGALLSMAAGSAAQVLIAWLPEDERSALLVGAAFTAADLGRVRSRGYAHSVAQREPGVASLSAPVRDPSGRVVAAISVSGPADRLARPHRDVVRELLATADDLSAALH